MNISSKTKFEGVWWFIVHEHQGARGATTKVPVYTKAQLWFDAREILGGHPAKVLDAKVCSRLEKELNREGKEE